MARLTRAQQQERTRAAVVAAARAEFAEHGYVAAKVDRIAARAELTRGGVYSNFPSKRALYLAVLQDGVDRAAAAGEPAEDPPVDAADALTRFARVWLERLPLTGDAPADGHLRLRSLSGLLDDPPTRDVLAQVLRVEALLLGLALESLPARPGHPVPRRVRTAELVLTLLHGAGGLAETAPTAVNPFDLARACGHLADLDLADTWDPPHLPFVAPARPADERWSPPDGVRDAATGRAVDLAADGVVAVLGAGRLSAAEEAVRAVPRGGAVTVLVATPDPAETGRLVRVRLADLAGCLRRAVGCRPALGVVVDDAAAIAAVLGGRDVDDATEAAVRVHGGRVVARAGGPGAGHAAATAPVTTGR